MEYEHCLKNYPKSIYLMIAKAARRTYKYTCLDHDMMSRTASHLKCFNRNTRNQTRVLNDKLVHYFELASRMRDVDDVLPALCCGSYELMLQIRDDVRRICTPISGEETADFLAEMIYNDFYELLVMGCRGPIRYCDKEYRDLTIYMRNQLKSPQRYENSYVTSLMRVIRRLDKGRNLRTGRKFRPDRAQPADPETRLVKISDDTNSLQPCQPEINSNVLCKIRRRA